MADPDKPEPFLAVLGQSWKGETYPGDGGGGGGEGIAGVGGLEEMVICEEDASSLEKIFGERGEGEAWREAGERGAVKPVRYNMIWCGMLWFGIVWYGMVW